jgi:hypothetical protein
MTATKRADQASLRVLARIERARYRHGWSVHSHHSYQHCPSCRATVRAPLPDGVDDHTPEAIEAFGRKVINLLTDAVIEHLHHECPTPNPEHR